MKYQEARGNLGTAVTSAGVHTTWRVIFLLISLTSYSSLAQVNDSINYKQLKIADRKKFDLLNKRIISILKRYGEQHPNDTFQYSFKVATTTYRDNTSYKVIGNTPRDLKERIENDFGTQNFYLEKIRTYLIAEYNYTMTHSKREVILKEKKSNYYCTGCDSIESKMVQEDAKRTVTKSIPAFFIHEKIKQKYFIKNEYINDSLRVVRVSWVGEVR